MVDSPSKKRRYEKTSLMDTLGIPSVGLGTAGLKGEACTDAVERALGLGYRHIDTALLYGNQEAIGEALRRPTCSSIPRDDLWITSKVAFFPKGGEGVWMWSDNNVKGGEAASIQLSLKQLGVDRLDLLLVHNPCTSKEEYSSACLPHFFELFNYMGNENAVKPIALPDGSRLRDLVMIAKAEAHSVAQKNGVTGCSPADAKAARIASWRALEEAQKQGLAKHIGVSNYPAELLQEMKEYATVMPAVNQLELHPRYASPGLQKMAEEMGVLLTAYGSCHAALTSEMDDLARTSGKVINEIAQRLARPVVQIILKWTLQHGIVVIPRSKSAENLASNLEAAADGLMLSTQDMAALDALNENYPLYWDERAALRTLAS